MKEILEALEDSRREFVAAFDGLSEAQAGVRLEEGRWSALDCAEHLFLVEERFLQRLETAPRTKTGEGIDREKEATVAAGMGNRTRKAQAPDAVQPTGQFSTLVDALENFHAARARSAAFVHRMGSALYTLDVEHARFGPMNGAEFLKLSSFHTRRHADQVREIRAALTSR
jgi:hypothetical protein